ncbi:hypothetical protein [Actinoplanes palleronii]|uniref:Uncharacterized protein n=1 Tax=Actinoplanes palleronii TaxID=113570 RepID=A0ABQ4B6X6_9ACTN|nr:hypothetical protein [Actinoplanes palleronii]GIE66393.1 hypothetical protein Apa02nite_025010 [Actinoplanes palleronii]
MERGPMALFGAIVAVGVGPALWLGVQLGAVDAPVRPPGTTILQQLPAAEADPGGAGAGEESETSAPTVRWTVPASNRRPLTASPSPSPSVSASASPSASVSPSASDSPGTPEATESPTPSAEPSEPSSEPSDPPTESTPEPEPSTSSADPGDEPTEPGPDHPESEL